MANEFWTGYNNAREMSQNMLARQAGGMIAAGDEAGGANALLRGGQLDAGYKVRGHVEAQNKAKLEARDRFYTGIARMLETPEYAANPEKAFNDALPYAERLDPSLLPELAKDRELYVRNPKAWAAMRGQETQEALQIIEGPNGIYAVGTKSGNSRKVQDYPEAPIALDPEKNYYVREGTPGFNPNAPDPRRMGGAGGFDAVIDPLLQREGGFVAKDGRSGAPANFGINQRYNPDVDVRNLTPEKAKELYRSRYWDAIGGDQLPPEAQAAVFDAAVNQGPQRAMQWWRQSGGDLNRFNQLRLQHYRSRPDYAQNGKSWEARVAETGGGLQGGAGQDTVGGLPGYRQVQAAQPKVTERWVDLPGGGQRNTVTGKTEGLPKSGGRLPAAALNLQNDHLSAIQTASAINTRLAGIGAQLDSGELNLGPVSNVLSGAANFIGKSDPQTRNYASFRANLEKLRNDSLRLNKGVQTEGDAQRAWKELMANLNDEGVVRQRLTEIEGYNRQALAFHEDSVAQLREDAGLPPIDPSRFRAKAATKPAASPPQAKGGGLPTLTPEQAKKLPKGARFRTTDGREMIRQ
jgi:hypothetical protein